MFIIIAAHNEAAGISRKILNCLEFAYPNDRYEIFIASDGSTDGTVDIVRSFAARGVKLIEIPDRHGKQYAQLRARDLARGEILGFTDAGVELNSDALQTIVSNFADPSVGCVKERIRSLDTQAGRANNPTLTLKCGYGAWNPGSGRL